MITNQMRTDLLTLGWSRDEMRHLTPKECWEIIDRGVPKKPSREMARSQQYENYFWVLPPYILLKNSIKCCMLLEVKYQISL